MSKATDNKKTVAAKGIDYTFDRNGALVVNPYALLASEAFRGQIKAAIRLGRLQRAYPRKKLSTSSR
jgi:hypothetical protein